MFGIKKRIRRNAAYDIRTMLQTQKNNYAVMQVKANKSDYDTFAFYQNKINALADLQHAIEQKFNLLN
jgi:hypothetical protein